MIDPVVTDEAANDLSETRSRERWQDGKALRMEQAEELAMRALSNQFHRKDSEESLVFNTVCDWLSDIAMPLIAEFFKAKYSPTNHKENFLQMLDAKAQLFHEIEAIAHKRAAEIVDARL